jgi:hypothetical protein
LKGLLYSRPSESAMIRYYASTGLQLVGLIVTIESLLIYFGDMGPMMQTAAIGVGLFYAGRFLRPKD